MFCGCLRRPNIVVDEKCEKISEVSIPNKLYKYFLKYNNSRILFDINEYKPKKLGNGASATAYKLIIENDSYTCKHYKKDKKYQNEIIKEIEILKQIKCERFPLFCTYLKQSNDMFIFYEYIDGEDLYEVIDKKYNIINNKKSQLSIIYEITKALYTLFKNNFVHLDLKPENIMITNLNPIKLKLIDLECVHNIQDSKIKRQCGTIGYTPPEIVLHSRYYYNSDIWSLGCIFFLLLTEYLMFPTDLEPFVKTLKNFTSIYRINSIITSTLINLPKNIVSLLNKMLKSDHTERINITYILKCKLMRDLTNNTL